MGDDRRTSASDELLDRARDGVNSDFGSFEPEPIHAPDYDDMLHLDSASSDDPDTGLSAAEIAAQLEEMGAVRTPDPASADAEVGVASQLQDVEPVPEPAAEAVLIPEWARTEAQEIPIPEGTVRPPIDPPANPPMEAGPSVFESSNADDGGDQWNTASPEWEAYQAERDAKRAARSRFNMPMPSVRALIGLAVLGFFLLPVIFNVVTGREHITALDVGDCFTAGNAFEIETVPVVDCAEEHDSELFAKVTLSEFSSSYPGEDPLFESAFEQCINRFEAYVGEPYDASPYYVETFIPLEDGWGQGDRTALCTIVVVDSNLETITTTGSRRNIVGTSNA